MGLEEQQLRLTSGLHTNTHTYIETDTHTQAQTHTHTQQSKERMGNLLTSSSPPVPSFHGQGLTAFSDWTFALVVWLFKLTHTWDTAETMPP